MRNSEQIRENAQSIAELINQVDNQIQILENEYQQNAIKMTGCRCDSFDEIINNLKNARQSLNHLMHMEIDNSLELENSENE